jgi:hypothetical protein
MRNFMFGVGLDRIHSGRCDQHVNASMRNFIVQLAACAGIPIPSAAVIIMSKRSMRNFIVLNLAQRVPIESVLSGILGDRRNYCHLERRGGGNDADPGPSGWLGASKLH